MNENQLYKEILNLTDKRDANLVQKDEFIKVISNYIQVLKLLRKDIEDNFKENIKISNTELLRQLNDVSSNIQSIIDKVNKTTQKEFLSNLSGLKSEIRKNIESVKEEIEEKIEEVELSIPEMPVLTLIENRIEEIKKQADKISQSTISKSELEIELNKLFNEVKTYIAKQPRVETRSMFGRTGMQIYYNGTKVGTRESELNFGIGFYVYTDTNGRKTVIARASDSILTATGTINSINTTFTFASKPSRIVVDGAEYRETSAAGTTYWTWTAGTLTAVMVTPPTDEIFGIS